MKTLLLLLVVAAAIPARAEADCEYLNSDYRHCIPEAPDARVIMSGNAATLATAFTAPSRTLGRDIGVNVAFERAAAPLTGVFACGPREIGDPGDGYSEIVSAATLSVTPGVMRVNAEGARHEFPLTATALRLYSCESFVGQTPFTLSPTRGGGVFFEAPIAGREELLRVSVELINMSGAVRAGSVTGYCDMTVRINSSIVRRIERGYSFLEHFAPQFLTLR